MYAALDVVEVADDSGLDVQAVAAVHFRLGSRLGLHWVHDRIVALPREDRWQAMARAALRDDLYTIHRELTAEVLRLGPRLESPDERVAGWIEAHRDAGRCLQTLADIAAGRTFDITTLSVAVREVRELLDAAHQDERA
jgi:glutamate dehydrogenase